MEAHDRWRASLGASEWVDESGPCSVVEHDGAWLSSPTQERRSEREYAVTPTSLSMDGSVRHSPERYPDAFVAGADEPGATARATFLGMPSPAQDENHESERSGQAPGDVSAYCAGRLYVP